MGPTAIGKTAVAIALCERVPAEVISVDSAMVYRGMDIGTGKPGPAERRSAPHHLVDIREPTETYSCASFVADAVTAARDILLRGRRPLLVGGTGLYFRALDGGLSPLPHASEEVRRRLEQEAEQLGWEGLHRRLSSVDPASARRIHPNDRQRIQRALEIWELTGRPWSEQLRGRREAKAALGSALSPGRTFVLVPASRAALHSVIAERFRLMLKAGLLEEVETLRKRGGFRPAPPALRAVGYRQVWAHLAGEIDRDEMVARAVAATRQLARRQLTWLRASARTADSAPRMISIDMTPRSREASLLGAVEVILREGFR